MKIGFDAKRAFYNSRGLGQYSRTLISNLHKSFPENRYTLFSPGKGRIRDWCPSDIVEVRPKSFIGKAFSTAWRSLFLSGRIHEKQLDIYHGLSHELPPRIEKTGVVSVVTIHDLLFMRFPQFYSWIDRKIYERKFKHSVKVATKVIAICEQTKKDIVEYLNCPEDKVEVIYQSCGSKFKRQLFYDEKGAIQEKYQLPSKYLLYVGALEENKNVISVVKALGTLKKRKILVPFIIVGRGSSYKKKLMHEVEKLGLSHQVYFFENIPNEDLVGFYQNGTSFIFPSFFEGFGIPIIEALSSGLPVITTRGYCFHESGGPSTIYANTSSIDEIAGAIEKVFGDETLRQKMKADGIEYVKRFSAENTANALMNLYKSIL